MIIGARWAGLSVSLLLGLSHTTGSQVYSENKKYPESGSSADRNTLLMGSGQWRMARLF